MQHKVRCFSRIPGVRDARVPNGFLAWAKRIRSPTVSLNFSVQFARSSVPETLRVGPFAENDRCGIDLAIPDTQDDLKRRTCADKVKDIFGHLRCSIVNKLSTLTRSSQNQMSQRTLLHHLCC